MRFKNLLIITIFTLLSLFILNKPVFCNESETAGPTLTAGAAFLMDNQTGKVLYSYNENEKMYPASTTKILTALVVIENCNLEDVVTADFTAISSIPEGYTTAGIQIGEQFTVEQLLELLLIRSYNDAANILAKYAGGTIESFVSMLNTKIADIGLTNTHFTNAYGLHDENHYTTAYDLAYIMKYCLENETFRTIAGRISCNIPATNLSEPRSFISTNEMLISDSTYYYKYLMTGKTGYTSQAKECLVSSGYKNDLELIQVILGSDNRFTDARNLYEYGFSNYSITTIIPANSFATSIDVTNGSYNTRNLNLLTENEISILLPNSFSTNDIEPTITLNDIIMAPIEEGDILGTITYVIDGNSYSTNLVASHHVEESEFLIYGIYTGIFLVFLLVIIEFYFYIKEQIIT